VFKGDLWTQNTVWTEDPKEKGINVAESFPGNGFITEPFKIKQGANSGYQAINLAYHFGAKRVILLGYDMSNNGRWHSPHPSPCGNHNTHNNFATNFNQMRPPIEVINCSRYTELTAFPTMKLEDLLQNII